eukprot:4705804-Amphidinium_carterae.1
MVKARLPHLQKWLRQRGFRVIAGEAKPGISKGTKGGVALVCPAHIGMTAVEVKGAPRERVCAGRIAAL